MNGRPRKILRIFAILLAEQTFLLHAIQSQRKQLKRVQSPGRGIRRVRRMNRRWNRESSAKHPRLSQCKSQIPHADGSEAFSRKRLRISPWTTFIHLIFNCRGDPRQTCRPHCIQQFSLASKMSVSGIRRDPRLPGSLSQNDCTGSSSTGHLEPGRHERVAQITVAKGLALLNGDVLFHCLFKKSVPPRGRL